MLLNKLPRKWESRIFGQLAVHFSEAAEKMARHEDDLSAFISSQQDRDAKTLSVVANVLGDSKDKAKSEVSDSLKAENKTSTFPAV